MAPAILIGRRVRKAWIVEDVPRAVTELWVIRIAVPLRALDGRLWRIAHRREAQARLPASPRIPPLPPAWKARGFRGGGEPEGLPEGRMRDQCAGRSSTSCHASALRFDWRGGSPDHGNRMLHRQLEAAGVAHDYAESSKAGMTGPIRKRMWRIRCASSAASIKVNANPASYRRTDRTDAQAHGSNIPGRRTATMAVAGISLPQERLPRQSL